MYASGTSRSSAAASCCAASASFLASASFPASASSLACCRSCEKSTSQLISSPRLAKPASLRWEGDKSLTVSS